MSQAAAFTAVDATSDDVVTTETAHTTKN